MRDFWDKDWLYSTLRRYVDFTTRRSYCRLTVEGELPPDNDGIATIYAPNHTNTLMDALVVLQLRRGGTLVITAWWGIWHIISGLTVSTVFHRYELRHKTS